MGSKHENATQSIISSIIDGMPVLAAGTDVEVGNFYSPWPEVLQCAEESQTEEDLEKVRVSMQSAKAVEETLRLLLASTSKVVTRLQDRFMDLINRTRFSNLHDDILGAIFEFACHNCPATTTALSAVSNRFRRLVLRLPTRIEFPCHSLDYASHLASRETASNISFVVSSSFPPSPDRFYFFPDDREPLTSMLQLAASISLRLRTMSLNFNHTVDPPFLQNVARIFAEVSLPNLHELNLESDISIAHQSKAICSGWDMPSLRRIEATNVLPDLPSSVASQIRTCRLDVNKGNLKNADHRWRKIEIADFLESLTSLEHLDIALHFVGREQDNEDLSLETVKRLTLRLPCLDVALGPNIFDLVEFPNIDSLDLEIGIPSLSKLSDVLKTLSDSFEESYPGDITDLTVTLVHEQGSDLAYITFSAVAGWCREFESLRHVTLNSPKDRGHGLFSFANTVDSFRFNNLQKGCRGSLLGIIPDIWETGACRRALLDGDTVAKTDCELNKLMDMIQFVGKEDDPPLSWWRHLPYVYVER